MSTLTLWTRRDPFAEFDAIVRRAFNQDPSGFTPSAEIARDGDDAVIRLELPGIDVEKDVTVEIKDNAAGRAGRAARRARRGARRPQPPRGPLRRLPPQLRPPGPRHRRRGGRDLRRRRPDRPCPGVYADTTCGRSRSPRPSAVEPPPPRPLPPRPRPPRPPRPDLRLDAHRSRRRPPPDGYPHLVASPASRPGPLSATAPDGAGAPAPRSRSAGRAYRPITARAASCSVPLRRQAVAAA